jgi:hypothetical protein
MKPKVLAVVAGLCRGVGAAFTKSVMHTDRVVPLTGNAAQG